MYRFAHVEKFSRRFLWRHARALDHIDIWLRAAVADGRLVGIHLDDSVVHAHGGKRRENVFDRVHPHRAFANGRRALDRFQIVDLRVNRWFVLQILALEFDSVFDRRGLQLERNFFARVQRRAAEPSGLSQSLLNFRRSHAG